MEKSKRFILTVTLLFGLLLAVLLLRPRREEPPEVGSVAEPTVTTVPTIPTPTPLPSPSLSPSPATSPSAARPAQMSGEDIKRMRERKWREFQGRFGSKMQGEFLPDGRVASVRNEQGSAVPAGGDFTPTDPEKATARAREVLNAAADLLGFQRNSPLGTPVARGGADSAQVFFQQTFDGLPIAPYGSVTVHLGAHGELIRIDSAYISPLRVVNQSVISAEQARDVALKATGQGNAKAEGGALIVWVQMPVSSQGPVEGKRAFEFFVSGRQVIVDASTGRVLFQRDRRVF